MQRALVISSFVAKGSVGLQATLPALSRADVDINVIAMPTIVLSNHPGFKACAGTPIAIDALDAIIDAIDANGWLRTIDAVFTGYLPSVDHVHLARRTVDRVKTANPEMLYVADPVLGDDPGGLYIGSDTAQAIRSTLLPAASVITPNRFELSWLSGQPVTDVASAIEAARSVKVPLTAATSVPQGDLHLANVLVSHDAHWIETVDRVFEAPHGTGDYFAGALLAAVLSGASHADALAAASRQTAKLLDASVNSDDLVFADQ